MGLPKKYTLKNICSITKQKAAVYVPRQENHAPLMSLRLLYHILGRKETGVGMVNSGNLTNKELVIQSIITAMSTILETVQLQALDNVLRTKLHGLRVEEESTELSTWTDDNDYMIRIFCANKKLEGCKESSLAQYRLSVRQLFDFINKNYREITKDDIKYFLAARSLNVSQNTLVNTKRNLSSFFTFLHDEGYITMHPVKTIKGMKPLDTENIHLTLEEEVAVRDVEKTIRDEALTDFLFSTGVRVGEAAAMNISDVNFTAGTVTFRGEKSDRIRTVVLDARAKLHLIMYLESRKDSNPALFVTDRTYHGIPRRLGKSAIEDITKAIGVRAGLDKALTVHVFRRTFATRMADKGCPLETLQELMGHRSPETTKRYIARSQKRIHREAARYMEVA